MRTKTKITIIYHTVLFLAGVAFGTFLFYRECPPQVSYRYPYTYDDDTAGCGCADSFEADSKIDTLYKPTTAPAK